MKDKKHEAIMTVLVPQIVGLISEKYMCGEVAASKEFYESGVYEILEQENTKLWHLSPLTLFNMYMDERERGKFEFPEEV